MSDTERRYAQVEKEALAITWACERFSTYILGKVFTIKTDHKPLIPLLGEKSLDSLPPRILRFRLCLSRFSYSIVHVPGKQMYTADTLSRAPISAAESSDLQEEAELLLALTVAYLPASSQRINALKAAQSSDAICSTLISYCQTDWPSKHHLSLSLKPYWNCRGELTVHNNLLLYRSRIVIPLSMQQEVLHKLHEGHQGIQRCRSRTRISVWWPGISKHIADIIAKCPTCVRESTPRKEPLFPSQLPDYPWQKIGTDLFYLNNTHYVLIVDYFSRFIEVIKLRATTSKAIIDALKSVFCRYGIPETVRSDNGPQYSSSEFATFARECNFHHVTSSPLFPQSNGQVERAIQTAKKLLKRSDDPYMALLAYRSTPMPWCNLSPAELLMGRRLRSSLPATTEQLKPTWTYLETFHHLDQQFKQQQKADFDRRHRSYPLPPIPNNTDVWVTSGPAVSGRVTRQADAPRSYMVETPNGEVRRNRTHLNVVPPNQATSTTTGFTPESQRPVTRSMTGTAIQAPERFRQ